MLKLENLQTGTRVRGLAPEGVATVKSVNWYGDQGMEVVFTDAQQRIQQRLIYRDDEPSLELVEEGRPWSFTADGELLRLVSEAWRIKLAWMFDPYLAITTSIIEPLPHQISAVYEHMLPRQPLRYLLADDPGAGKTIMAGLFIKELLVRGELERCLIVSPGSLTEQWQDELAEKFGLEFELLSREMIQNARTGNPFHSAKLMIARLDQLSRNDELNMLIKGAPEWDLIICDEAHKMSAHYISGEVKATKRYRLGQLLGTLCRNLLLLTATPHNGINEDFQLFLALLDGDRFEGRFRDGVHTVDSSDMMRRMIKEELLRFDGRPLFPERKSYTVQYELSDLEAALYTEVTDYVREEMNRAERFAPKEGQRRVNVGFALMTLQRRLASSPKAIFRSIERRQERLERRLREERLRLRGIEVGLTIDDLEPRFSDDDLDDIYEDAPQEEREEVEQSLVDNATAARTIEELEIEIGTLKNLEESAKKVVLSREDAKWNQLNSILDDPLMIDDTGARRKLVVFTEFKDTLLYLAERIRTRLGKPEAVVEIHGGVAREERRKIVHGFMNDPTILILVANDAAGEGVNLQRAHLMVNYDLPWNPNRLEQRFGRIHRIGQDEVCHLWNLVAKETREGDIYYRLLQKLEAEKEALGGKVFDVLGELFDQRALRELMMEAIRYGNDPEVKAKLQQKVDNTLDRDRLIQVMETRALTHDNMDTTHIQAIREEMERAHARRLQPNYIQAFFQEAFSRLGGMMNRREAGRFEITHVPQPIRDRDRQIGVGAPVLKRYERVCFEKSKVDQQPRAFLITPGMPLLESAIDLTLERHRDVLKQGAVLVDENDPGDAPRLLFYLEHEIIDGRIIRHNEHQVISTRLQFVDVLPDETFRDAGVAPYLDCRPATKEELTDLQDQLDAPWLRRDWEQEVIGQAIKTLVPKHLNDVKPPRLALLDKIEQEVRSRMQKEINHWDHRAQDLLAQEKTGKRTRLPAADAQNRADLLADRLQKRMDELKLERAISPLPPKLVGGALIVPTGLLARTTGEAWQSSTAEGRAIVEKLAMDAIMETERSLGRIPRDVHETKGIGYDIESRDPATGEFVFVEVKGHASSNDHISITRTEILCALNEPEKFRLAVVLVEDGAAKPPVYIRHYDYGQPGFAQTGSTYSLANLLKHGGKPE